MQTTNNTILITGGSTGIGLAMAETFIQEGNQVLFVVGGKANCLKQNKKIQIFIFVYAI
jgi:uncharacterized oxidoreductase